MECAREADATMSERERGVSLGTGNGGHLGPLPPEEQVALSEMTFRVCDEHNTSQMCANRRQHHRRKLYCLHTRRESGLGVIVLHHHWWREVASTVVFRPAEEARHHVMHEIPNEATR